MTQHEEAKKAAQAITNDEGQVTATGLVFHGASWNIEYRNDTKNWITYFRKTGKDTVRGPDSMFLHWAQVQFLLGGQY